MAKITFSGLDLYAEELNKIADRLPKMIDAALYEGAKVVADQTQKEIEGLTELTPEARQGLHDGLGVAHFWRDGGATVTKIGFEGYNKKRTKRWPNGQPNAMIARSLIRGTSCMRANRFTARAAKKARERSIEAMQQRLDQDLKKYTT